MAAPESFCILIVSNRRPQNVVTAQTLRKSGNTAPWYIVVDDEDPTIEHYRLLHGTDRVIVFNRAEQAALTDTGDTNVDAPAVVYARNACFGIARDLGYDYFLNMDDDYTAFHHRFETADRLGYVNVDDFDGVSRVMLDFLEDTGADCVALGQGGDLIGGKDNIRWKAKLMRKSMNTFYCRSSADWRFMGRLNEDVNTYVAYGNVGRLFFTTLYTTLVQVPTQGQQGGMTETYELTGTYAKSFFTVMYCPSAVRVTPLHTTHSRLHHLIDWSRCVPKILPETYRKGT